MAKYYDYTVTAKGQFQWSKFAEGSPWTFHCRAPDSETAKLTAAQHFQKHRTPMFKKPKSLVFLMSHMSARRDKKQY